MQNITFILFRGPFSPRPDLLESDRKCPKVVFLRISSSWHSCSEARSPRLLLTSPARKWQKVSVLTTFDLKKDRFAVTSARYWTFPGENPGKSHINVALEHFWQIPEITFVHKQQESPTTLVLIRGFEQLRKVVKSDWKVRKGRKQHFCSKKGQNLSKMRRGSLKTSFWSRSRKGVKSMASVVSFLKTGILEIFWESDFWGTAPYLGGPYSAQICIICWWARILATSGLSYISLCGTLDIP